MATATAWTHRDLLRLAHPPAEDPSRRALFDWVCGRGLTDDAPALLHAFESAQEATTATEWVSLIADHPLSWEMLPDAALTHPQVWHALIAKGMPQTALMRQLPRLTRLGVLDGSTLATVVAQLQDPVRLRKGRVHPINVLVAARTYASGQSAAGSSSWQPKRQIIDALDAAFYAAFGAVEPAGKRTLLALDVSGSMTAPAAGLPLSCREASAALALVTMATEPDTTVVGFTAGDARRQGWGWRAPAALTELSLSPRQRLDDAIRAVSNLPFGGTDCALPMIWAEQQQLKFDTIVVYTDSETWHGQVHPFQALQSYRRTTGLDTRLVVVGLAGNEFTIADPADPGMLDVAGLDSAVPQLITDFSRGDI